MAKAAEFEVQGHRGARGLLPENTLPSFEIALDVGVTSIETDVHLSRDDVAVLFHDSHLTDRLCTPSPGAAAPLVRSLTLEQLRGYRIGPAAQTVTPAAQRFAEQRGIHPYGIPTLAEFFAFVADYAGVLGEQAGKTNEQRERASTLIFDIELKRVPFTPETIGDGFDGKAPALLEVQVVEAIRAAGVLAKARVRSFDHRSMVVIRQLEPTLLVGLLIYETAPAHIGKLLEAAHAEIYCPDYRFVDADIVRQVHAVGARIIPYTVNEPDEWRRLLAWGVDGVTSDYPDRLVRWLGERV